MKKIIVQEMAKPRNVGSVGLSQPAHRNLAWKFVSSTRAWLVPDFQSHSLQGKGLERQVASCLHCFAFGLFSLILTDCCGLFHHL